MNPPADKAATPTEPVIRTATLADANELARITAEAFREDPFNRWVFGDGSAMHQSFRLFANAVYAPAGRCLIADGLAAAMWLAPDDRSEISKRVELKIAINLLRYGGVGATARAAQASAALATRRPKTPHAYLFTVGVTEQARGTGLGRGILRAMLTTCDAAGWDCYLESSNPENRSFYEALGFEVLERFVVNGRSPPVEAMLRGPVSAPNQALREIASGT